MQPSEHAIKKQHTGLLKSGLKTSERWISQRSLSLK